MKDELEKYKKMLEEINTEIANHPENLALLDDRERIKFMIAQIGREINSVMDVKKDLVPTEKVNIGDYLDVAITYPDGEVENMSIHLVDMPTSSLNEVSVNSPIGMAIVGKKIGSFVEYDSPVGKCKIEILNRADNLKR